MNDFLGFLRTIIKDTLTGLYQSLLFSVVIAVLFMDVYLKAKEIGWKKIANNWKKSFLNEKSFRRMFFFSLYASMILFRTLFNRSMWTNPVKDVIGVWGLHNSEGNISTEVIENLVLFIPFSFLALLNYGNRIIGENHSFINICWKSVKWSFLFSFVIEMIQLFLRLGTFQLSDLFYNTLGGLIGGIIFATVYTIRSRRM